MPTEIQVSPLDGEGSNKVKLSRRDFGLGRKRDLREVENQFDDAEDDDTCPLEFFRNPSTAEKKPRSDPIGVFGSRSPRPTRNDSPRANPDASAGARFPAGPRSPRWPDFRESVPAVSEEGSSAPGSEGEEDGAKSPPPPSVAARSGSAFEPPSGGSPGPEPAVGASAAAGSAPPLSSSSSSSAGAAVASSSPPSPSADAPSPPLPSAAEHLSTAVANPGVNDVIFGRGHGPNTHAGNVRFRNLLKFHKMRYLAAWKAEKPRVAREVVALWRRMDPPGRFLMRPPTKSKGRGRGRDKNKDKDKDTDKDKKEESAVWTDVGDKRAQEKTSQCLRERTAEIMGNLREEVGEKGMRDILETIRRTHKPLDVRSETDRKALSRALGDAAAATGHKSDITHVDLMEAAGLVLEAMHRGPGGPYYPPVIAPNGSLNLLASVANDGSPRGAAVGRESPTKRRRCGDELPIFPAPGPVSLAPRLPVGRALPLYGAPPLQPPFDHQAARRLSLTFDPQAVRRLSLTFDPQAVRRLSLPLAPAPAAGYGQYQPRLPPPPRHPFAFGAPSLPPPPSENWRGSVSVPASAGASGGVSVQVPSRFTSYSAPTPKPRRRHPMSDALDKGREGEYD